VYKYSLGGVFCEIQTLPNGHPNGSGKSEQEQTFPEGNSPKHRGVEAWIPLGGTNDAKNMVSNVLERFQIIDREFTASDDGGIGLPWWVIKQTRRLHSAIPILRSQGPGLMRRVVVDGTPL
jgi:hypothetical protein